MNRRDIIKYTALATSAAISAPLLSTILVGCQPKQELSAKGPKFFNAEENKFLTSLIDTILPSTDSPSASDVGVHLTIDHMISHVYSADQQKTYRLKFDKLSKFLNESQRPFLEKSDEERLQDLRNIAQSGNKEVKDALTEVKQQTIAYYLLTEEIGKNFLNYLPVPGPYQGCITLEEVNSKAWAL